MSPFMNEPAHQNPFVYGRPVPPELFVGRSDVVSQVLSRARTGQSTAIVGEPRFGKTSTLRFVGGTGVRSGDIPNSNCRCHLVSMDAHLLGHDSGEGDFWNYFCCSCKGILPSDLLGEIETACQGTSGFERERFFRRLGEGKVRVVLLIDEFDSLLYHPGLANGNLFCTLRTLCTSTQGLGLVTSGHMNLTAMDRRGEDLRQGGSPLFNYLVEQRLSPLSPDDVETLLGNALRGSAISFSADERSYVQRMSGGLPYLVQLVAAQLFEMHARGSPTSGSLSGNLLNVGNSYCEEIWRHLPIAEQRVLALLVLGKKRGSLGKSRFDVKEYHNLNPFEKELRILAEIGVVAKLEVFDESQWCIGSELFSEWLALALRNRDQVSEIQEWLSDRKKGFIFTGGQRKRLWNDVTHFPYKAFSELAKNVVDRLWPQ